MSRRPRTVREQRIARAIRRATAAGHVIASSSPVVRPDRITMGAVATPVEPSTCPGGGLYPPVGFTPTGATFSDLWEEIP